MMLKEELFKYIRSKGLTLAIAESCTGGMIGATITSFSGASSFFKGGAIVYSNELKTDVLGIPSSILEEHGAVSYENAYEMAVRTVRIFNSDLSIAVTGIAGPEGGTEFKPVGSVFTAVSDGITTDVREHHFPGSRENVRYASVEAAFEHLGDLLENRI